MHTGHIFRNAIRRVYSREMTVSGGTTADFFVSEGSISKTLPVGGVAGYVVETVLDEEAPAVAKVLEDSVLGVLSQYQK